MSDEDKKATVPDLPSAKSYSADGVTVEFDPSALQVHAISPELRQQMSGTELPRLDPKYLQDTAPPNRSDAALTTANQAAATTQPSLRRIQQAALPEPAWRRSALHGLLALVVLALLWEVTVLVRGSLSAREASQPEPPGSVPSSPGAPPRDVETAEPATGLETEHVSEPAQAEPALPASTSSRAEAASVPPATGAAGERASAGDNSSPAASPPRAAAPFPVDPPGHPGASVIQKPEGAAPQPASSSKSASKVLFPPQ